MSNFSPLSTSRNKPINMLIPNFYFRCAAIFSRPIFVYFIIKKEFFFLAHSCSKIVYWSNQRKILTVGSRYCKCAVQFSRAMFQELIILGSFWKIVYTKITKFYEILAACTEISIRVVSFSRPRYSYKKTLAARTKISVPVANSLY